LRTLSWLDQNIFETIEEAQEQATKWLWTYKNDRPNMAIGGITPAMKLKMAAWFYKRTPLKMGGLPIVALISIAVVFGLTNFKSGWSPVLCFAIASPLFNSKSVNHASSSSS
jgi:hypothetical protein